MTRPAKAAQTSINNENAMAPPLSAQGQHDDQTEENDAAAEHDEGGEREVGNRHGITSKTVLTVLVQLG